MRNGEIFSLWCKREVDAVILATGAALYGLPCSHRWNLWKSIESLHTKMLKDWRILYMDAPGIVGILKNNIYIF